LIPGAGAPYSDHGKIGTRRHAPIERERGIGNCHDEIEIASTGPVA
jgi:hypothetical protein